MARKDITDLMVVTAVDAQWGREAGTRRRLVEPRAVDRLMTDTGECEKVVYAALERSYDRGLIECGVNVAGSWLTPLGEAMLKASASTAKAIP
jgi:hypothetical protein